MEGRGADTRSILLDGRRVFLTRQELQEMKGILQQTVATTNERETRELAEMEIGVIEERLDNGDFQVGDRIAVTVQGESALTDTFTVQRGQLLDLTGIGVLELAGVLRVELQDTVAGFLSRYLRNPVVRTQSFIPLTVNGAVSRPGFYPVPIDAQLADVLMVAQGALNSARIDRISIRRNNDEIFNREDVQQAIAQGYTVDQLTLRPGDELYVPDRGRSSIESVLRVTVMLVTLPAAIYGLTRIF